LTDRGENTTSTASNAGRGKSVREIVLMGAPKKECRKHTRKSPRGGEEFQVLVLIQTKIAPDEKSANLNKKDGGTGELYEISGRWWLL